MVASSSLLLDEDVERRDAILTRFTDREAIERPRVLIMDDDIIVVLLFLTAVAGLQASAVVRMLAMQACHCDRRMSALCNLFLGTHVTLLSDSEVLRELFSKFSTLRKVLC